MAGRRALPRPAIRVAPLSQQRFDAAVVSIPANADVLTFMLTGGEDLVFRYAIGSSVRC